MSQVIYKLDEETIKQIRTKAQTMTPDQILEEMVELTNPVRLCAGEDLALTRVDEIIDRLKAHEWANILKEKLKE